MKYPPVVVTLPFMRSSVAMAAAQVVFLYPERVGAVMMSPTTQAITAQVKKKLRANRGYCKSYFKNSSFLSFLQQQGQHWLQVQQQHRKGAITIRSTKPIRKVMMNPMKAVEF